MLGETHWVTAHPSHSKFIIVFFYRNNTRSGRVAILVKKSIAATLVFTPNLPHIEYIGISINLPDQEKFLVLSTYSQKGDADSPEIESLLSFSTDSFCLIGGDFNAHHRIWENSRVNSKCGSSIAQCLK